MSLMLSCEMNVQGEWVEMSAIDISRGTRSPEIRCMHCHGEIRTHKPWAPESIRDHFEHKIHTDSEGCRGGVYHNPKEIHRMAANPVS